MTRLNALFHTVAALAVPAAMQAPALPPVASNHATARLISDSTALIPGTTHEIGIHLTIERGWHLYWDGQNDSGLPLTASWTLPEGFKAGPIRWPAPARHVLPGDILDHIYEEEVTLILPLSVPASAAVGSTVTLSAELAWLECSDVCIRGEQGVSVKLPVGKTAEKPIAKDAALFERARERLPRPLPKENSPVAVSWSGERVELTSPGAERLLFYPGNQGTRLTDAIKEADVKGSRMVLRLEEGAPNRRLQGVLEVRPPGKPSKPIYYEIDSEQGRHGAP